VSSSSAVPRPSSAESADPSAEPAPEGRASWAIAADAVAVLAFVMLGRRSHGESDAATGVLVTLWPFLAGLAAGWLVVLLRRGRPLAWWSGVTVVVATVALGMLLRHVVSHDGTPVSFVLVATTFLSIFLLGWRVPARRYVRRRGTS
jgi:peptidoglycan/LPS O-acetylase OafA/YrhL